MTTQEIAEKLVEYVRSGQDEKAHEELYSKDILSIENPVIQEGMMEYKEDKGMDAKNEKTKQWYEDLEEMHSLEVSDPLVVDNAFVVTMTMDITSKSMGRGKFSELAIYSVRDNKIIREEFIY